MDVAYKADDGSQNTPESVARAYPLCGGIQLSAERAYVSI